MDKIIEEAYKELPALEIKQLDNSHIWFWLTGFCLCFVPFLFEKAFYMNKTSSQGDPF